MAHLWESGEYANAFCISVIHGPQHPESYRNEFPNFLKVRESSGVEDKAAHEAAERDSLFSRTRLKASSPSMGFTWPLLISSYRPSNVPRDWG